MSGKLKRLLSGTPIEQRRPLSLAWSGVRATRDRCRSAALLCRVGALDDARYFNARCDAELAEGVAQVGLDRLGAEEELGGDLRIGLAVDDESCDLELAFGERVDAGSVCFARACAPMKRASELPELSFGLQSVAV